MTDPVVDSVNLQNEVLVKFFIEGFERLFIKWSLHRGGTYYWNVQFCGVQNVADDILKHLSAVVLVDQPRAAHPDRVLWGERLVELSLVVVEAIVLGVVVSPHIHQDVLLAPQLWVSGPRDRAVLEGRRELGEHGARQHFVHVKSPVMGADFSDGLHSL